MKFGVREIANVVFRAKAPVTIGSKTFAKGQPVLYIDSAKTSTLEGAATTVYAQGGRGNTRLIAWEGEKTLTFTVEDALLSPIGLSILSGAGLIKDEAQDVHVHMSTVALIDAEGALDLSDALKDGETICEDAPLFIMALEDDNSLTGEIYQGTMNKDKNGFSAVNQKVVGTDGQATFTAVTGKNVMVDYYVIKKGGVSEIQIDAENFAGYYYVEADTLFRRQNDGVDMPANITLPNVKIQSNFTFSMASTGDPSTFTFTMDAMPGYTYFDPSKKVLCVMQIIEQPKVKGSDLSSVMKHDTAKETDKNFEGFDESEFDSVE